MKTFFRLSRSVLAFIACIGVLSAGETNGFFFELGQSSAIVSNVLASRGIMPKSSLKTPSSTMLNYENIPVTDGLLKLFFTFKKDQLTRYTLTYTYSNQPGAYYLKQFEAQNSGMLSMGYAKKSEIDYADASADTNTLNRQIIFFRGSEIGISIVEYADQRKNLYLVVESKLKSVSPEKPNPPRADK
ncbi:MAG: hypothetical protein HZC28_12295 [Spirochaetes bacterium]|nr:hypothetical protein [Spirochaetota bacterium]